MNFKKNLNKLLLYFLLIFSIFIIPTKAFAYSKKVVLGGENIGIEVVTNGVLVVGFYNVSGNISPGSDASLKVGDRIIKIDDTVINGITDLSFSSNVDNETLKITFIRNGKEKETTLKLYKDKSDVYKTGLYVKDSIVGIGTLTFIDPVTKTYGALGHEIIEKTTGQKFEIKEGKIFKSQVTGITKSQRNSPGEKNASYDASLVYGTINKNNYNGIYGMYNAYFDEGNLIEASSELITPGISYIRTTINGDLIKEYAIEILKVYPLNETRNILFKVTDKNLLDEAGGIVQGMSGSPIIQNNKLVGAVTHVISDDTTKGFGIFIENMLKEIDN